MSAGKTNEIWSLDDADRFRDEYWENLSSDEKAMQLSLAEGADLRNAIMKGKQNIFKFLLGEIDKDNDKKQNLEYKDGTFPLITFLMTTPEIWLNKSLSGRLPVFEKMFSILHQRISERNKVEFEMYVLKNRDGLLHQCLGNMLSRPANRLKECISEERKWMLKRIFSQYAKKTEKIAGGIIDLVATKSLSSPSRRFKEPSVINTLRNRIRDNVFTDQSDNMKNKSVPRQVVHAMKQLYSHADKLQDGDDSVANDKGSEINNLVESLLAEKSDSNDPHDIVAEMKKKIKEKLDMREKGENLLLKNRSGKHRYAKASKVATFFKRPDYEYTDSKGEHHFADSTTEHRLIGLYNALDKWEEEMQQEQQKKQELQ